jgi:hypothetical protein
VYGWARELRVPKREKEKVKAGFEMEWSLRPKEQTGIPRLLELSALPPDKNGSGTVRLIDHR